MPPTLEELKDMVVVVFERHKGDYSFSLESNYTGDNAGIVAKYLNGILLEDNSY